MMEAMGCVTSWCGFGSLTPTEGSVNANDRRPFGVQILCLW